MDISERKVELLCHAGLLCGWLKNSCNFLSICKTSDGGASTSIVDPDPLYSITRSGVDFFGNVPGTQICC